MDAPRSHIAVFQLAVALLLLGGLFGPASGASQVAGADGGAMSAAGCSPYAGTWFHGGKGIPIIQRGDRLTVNMAAFRRPTANGRVLGDMQIEVSFPDDATFSGVLDGQGTIHWNNGTVWQATRFAGTWRHQGQPGPTVTQVGGRLAVSMAVYGRPSAEGTLTGTSTATVRFPDDATHDATLVGPNCIQWSNGTYWTR